LREHPRCPGYENLFDPDGANGGDPLQLIAALGDSLKITLAWSQPQGYDIANYEISHSLLPAEGYMVVGTVPHTTGPGASFTFRGADPTSTNYFRIRAYNSAGSFTNFGSMAQATRITPPLVYLSQGGRRVGTRNITLDVTVSRGDSLQIWVKEDPEGATTVGAPAAGEVGSVPFVLPTATENDTVFNLRVLAFPLAVATDTAKIALTVDFDPAFTVDGDSNAVASLTPELLIPDQGIVFMRFADTVEGLESQDWSPYAETYPGQLTDSANRQVVWGEFMSNFGFSAVASLGLTPDPLTDATFSIDLGPDNISQSQIVTLLAEAGATEMRYSEDPEFSSLAWLPFAVEHSFTLSPDAGTKTIYGQFRNDWGQSAILSDFVIYLSQPLEVAFAAPLGGDTLTGGIPLQVRGTALAAGSIDSVKFDAGDGLGFRLADGAEEWTYLWDVPTVELTSERVLRARAWAEGDSVTSSITVRIEAEEEEPE
jgi:hypothetical protein